MTAILTVALIVYPMFVPWDFFTLGRHARDFRRYVRFDHETGKPILRD